MTESKRPDLPERIGRCLGGIVWLLCVWWLSRRFGCTGKEQGLVVLVALTLSRLEDEIWTIRRLLEGGAK
jgi:hypothetical protein